MRIYVIGTSPRFARSKLRSLPFCDQTPWKDTKSSIVFFEFVSMDDLTFRKKKKEKNKGDRDFNNSIFYLLPPKKQSERSLMRLNTLCKPHKNTRYLLAFTLNVL